MDETLTVEVFPIAQARWIAVVDAPAGPFSTEVAAPTEVLAEVRRCIREVLGCDVPFMLADDLGRTWNVEDAREQLARLVSSSGT
jgi:hypothetical protein